MQPSSDNNFIRVQTLSSGLVQGVNYRWFVMERARELGVNGWVKNLPDGRVEAELEGREDSVNKLIEAMKKGPSSAHVSGVTVIPLAYDGNYKDFQVRH
jgi:acylphosphatase